MPVDSSSYIRDLWDDYIKETQCLQGLTRWHFYRPCVRVE